MEDNILGCFVSVTMGDEKGKLFRKYIFGENGISEKLKVLKYYNYGKDLKIILFQFYVNPEAYLLQNLKKIEDYRKSEKSIGIPIIINENNFFNKPELQRLAFLENKILEKLNLLDEVVKINNLDTDVRALIHDLKILMRHDKLYS